MDLAGLEVELRGLQKKALTDISATETLAALDELGSSLLGKRGAITDLLRGIGGLPAEDRPKVGVIANEVRAAIEAAVESQIGRAHV